MELTSEKIEKILQKFLLVDDLTDRELGEFCEYANSQYRAGSPVITDEDYDFIFLNALKNRVPSHKILQSLEPEVISFSEEKVLIPEAMLSIDKAYSFNEILKWIDRIIKSCIELNINTKKLIFRATPKLDGFAGYDDGNKLYTRGDGKRVVILQEYLEEVLRFLMILKEVRGQVKL